jgi:hypothetical protein
MRDVRQHEAPLDDLGRATFKDFSRLPPDQRGDALLGVQAGLQHGVDLGGGEIAGDAAVEHNVERIERALGLPELIGDDADRVVARQIRQPWMLGAGVLVGNGERRELHHRTHPGHFENIGLVVDGGHLPAERARALDGGVEHPGDHDVDAEDRAAVAFGRRIQARHRLADEMKSAALLERWRGAERQFGGGGGELPVRQPLAARIDDEAVLGAALRDIDVPRLRRRAGEHATGSSACNTQALIERRGRHRGALFLRRRLLPERDLVSRLAGHEPDLDALPIGVELVGENLRQRGVRPLPHLRLGEGERDLSARRDHDPIGDLVAVVALRSATPSHGDGNDEGCGRQRRSGENSTARHGQHHMLRGIG